MSLLLRVCALLIAALSIFGPLPVVAQDADAPIQRLLQEHGEIISKSSRRTIGPAIDALAASGLPEAQDVLTRWQAKEMWRDKESGLFVYAEEIDRRTIRTFDFATGAALGEFEDKGFKQLKPNSGIRGLIGAALVRFQLSDPNPWARTAALDAIERDADETHLAALRAVRDTEEVPALQARISRLERLLTIRFADDSAERIAAIEGFEGDLGVDVRAALNPLVATVMDVATTLPEDPAIARQVAPGTDDLTAEDAYALLVANDLAVARLSRDAQKAALIAHIEGDEVAGVRVAALNTEAARD
ncbi:MAG: urea ABC transporter permease subunit UrtB, partial [Pseudomonadota bacterium]